MMKFMCIFVCALAAVSASSYNRGYGSAPVGGYAYQVQPALTVKAIVPAGGYGSGGYGGSYGGGYGKSIEVPVSAHYTYSRNYGYGAAPVDRQAVSLAKLGLAAPKAGAPLLWKEPQRLVERSYGPRQSYNQQSSYGYGEEAQGGSAAAAASSVAGQNNGYKNSGYKSSGY
ncbi:PREDICTED: chorion protein S18 [Drosophila arizonae]|uniref:Chorion protein S18 n=1 Tax=Drosophila arizonae TaxID=7263 RepID=A0ABM1P4I2_DROAR|nr:PREDICTED: chorion protein S18 [Drosophila arizonae]